MDGRGGWETRRTFRDRAEAGEALAARLAGTVPEGCVVAAIPRGGVAVALPVARRLGAPLTVAYARKLSAPFAAELAFGAVDEDGEVVTTPETVEALGLAPQDVMEAKQRVRGEIQRRMARYRVPPLATYLPAPVVLVDDGLATGLTMEAAVRYARRHGATEVIVAVPCASVEAARRFGREADRFVGLVVDEDFVAVGQYYDDFSPVTDDEVVAMLEEARRARIGGGVGGDRLLTFRNPRGLELAGELLLPSGAGPFPTVVFAHGWRSGKESPRNRAAAEALRAAGFAACLFDFTGHGESEGTLEESTVERQVEDLGAAIDAVLAEGATDETRIGVAGASSGGAVALLRASIDSRIRALVLRSANPAGAEDAAWRVRVPTLLVVGEHDTPTLAANQALAARLAGPHRLEVVPGGDHLFEDPTALGRAVEATVAWFSEHLAPAAEGRRRHGAA
ncbi:MAG TPA: alpha/beta fold hydrolase [Thermodesulfobacteriota bacterium]